MNSNAGSAWNYVGGSATAKQRRYIDSLANQVGGYCDGVQAAAEFFGCSRSKLGKRGLDVTGASQVIDWLKKQIVPSAAADPEVQALKGEDQDVAELRKIAGLE